MSPVSTTTHVGSTSSAHVASVHWATSIDVSSSGSHITSHWSSPGGPAQAGKGTATPVEVSTVGVTSSECWGRQESARGAVEATARARGCGKSRKKK